MRYYNIQINNDDGSSFATFTSFPNGATDLGALQVEIDAPVSPLATPLQAASITIWGVSSNQIGQASDFNGKSVIVSAGMQKGLPLANPAQAGVIFQGVIWQAYGNWIETNQWVRFIVTNGGVNPAQSLNLNLNWQQGQTLDQAIQNTIKAALPNTTVTTNTSSSLVLPQDEVGYFNNLTQMAQYVQQVSLSIMNNPDYAGVSMVFQQGAIVVSDNSTPPAAKAIVYTDLIGQPTWIDVGTVQVTVVMRADLHPTDIITLPTTIITTAPSNPTALLGNKSIFQGSFLIAKMRHVGNFRQPDATAWVTTMDCLAQPATTDVAVAIGG